ncbi:MAG: Phage protein, partial [uncultured Sphingomonadaceae bacterium]
DRQCFGRAATLVHRAHRAAGGGKARPRRRRQGRVQRSQVERLRYQDDAPRHSPAPHGEAPPRRSGRAAGDLPRGAGLAL